MIFQNISYHFDPFCIICVGHTVEQEDTEEGDLAWLGTFRDVF